MGFDNIWVNAFSYYAPERILTNKDFERIVDTSDEWITQRTGIKERRIAADSQTTSDLAAMAGRKALEDSGLSPEEIDFIILATFTPDMPLPSAACLVQMKLGATKANAFDVSASCSGFLYGLSVASGLIASRQGKRALVLAADCLSRFTDYQDRRTCVLFGDGACAAVVRTEESDFGFRLLSLKMRTDPSGIDMLCIPAGGSRQPASLDTLDQRLHYVKMDGNRVYSFAVRGMYEFAMSALHDAGIQPKDVDLLVPHQANQRIIDSVRLKLGLPEDRVYINLSRYGNTSAASVGIALAEAISERRVQSGNHVLMVTFGGGFTLAGAVLKAKSSND